jgi:GT2 family glycosyltransferase
MDLSIIIVNWNSAEFVRKCLTSISREGCDLKYEVIVIDGASFDGCGEMLAREFAQVRFIQCPTNVGFARANNIASESAAGEYFLFLNPDTEIKGPAIKLLYEAGRRLPASGIIGAKLLNTDGSVQTSCLQAFPTIANQVLDAEVLRRVFPRLSLWGMAALFARGETPVDVDVISGACMLVSRRIFEDIGRFSEDYFMYSEDVDLCHKTRQAGWRNYFLPTATVVHYGGGSSQQTSSVRMDVLMRESRLLYFTKFRGGLYARLYRLAIGAIAIIRLLFMGVLLPFRLLDGNHQGLTRSMRKWRHILFWSLGMITRPKPAP